MDILRTDDRRFRDLPDFPYEPRYCEVPTGYGVDLRVHYVDEGPRDGPVMLLLHGEPTWSFLWRGVIPVLTAAGRRVVALDFPGFGRSDKPDASEYYNFEAFVQWTRLAALARIGLERLTIVGHGLGGLVGVSLAAVHWQAVERLVVVSPPLPPTSADGPADGPAERPAERSTAAYGAELRQAAAGELAAGELVARQTVGGLAPEAVAAYDAPFPSAAHRVALGRALERVDDRGGTVSEHVAAQWREAEKQGTAAVIVRGGRDRLAAPGGTAESVTLADAGHFLPEDRPHELAEICLGLR